MRAFLTGLLLASLATGAHAAATSRKTLHRVDVDVVRNCFHIHQEWEIRGATRARVLAAIRQLRLTGRYGIYGERKLLQTETPVSQQNNGEGVSAWAHPVGTPVFLGSRASTVPIEGGFRASMSGGQLGQGTSDVLVTEVAPGVLRMVERGTWRLSKLNSSSGMVNCLFAVGAATVGRIPLIAAHKAMGELHNRMFNPDEPICHLINDEAAGTLRGDE
jgi:hypothetical protein